MFIHSTAISKYLPCLIRLYSKVKFRLAFSLGSAAESNMANHPSLSKMKYPDVNDVGERVPPQVALNLGL